MALNLCFTRAKIFLDTTDGVERRFQGNPALRPVPAPDWIKNTQTFKYGVADKSIIDLTPPAARGKKAAAVAESLGDSAPAFDPTNIGKNAALPPVPTEPVVADEVDNDGKPKFGGTNKPVHPKGMPQAKGK